MIHFHPRQFAPIVKPKRLSDGTVPMTVHEFKKMFDADRDGRISEEELRRAVRGMGGWFPKMKAKKGLKSADKNGDGYIDDDEIVNLKDFALKHFGIRIITDK
ncbi:OLC1v1016735C1 [Oldenlandia corymbosa var. corymbosa]|uniref:OLC1v1016735C1 n=1 Tax=Oldenlandia corymbosa var. corymbosa TaxID=529605 RepID=A0AAV1E7T0_OLDCO|nr:OLC1v1016735C1 [Oldenlandia corymbosa var. corymbosa]